MDKRLKTRWVKALRSGKFKQGTGYLRYVDGASVTHCCLGVLCEVMKQKPADGGGFYLNSAYSNSALPRGTDPWKTIDFMDQETLMTMNDGGAGVKRRGFRGIALWIERNL